MSSPPTARTADSLAAQDAAIAEIERRLWDGGFNAAHLDAYQAAWRARETLIAAAGNDARHDFIIVIPVADRPQHIQACLASLLALCRAYGYGGQDDEGHFRKIAVIVADDSDQAENVAANQALARHYTAQGLATVCFTPAEQALLVDGLGTATQAALARVIGKPRAGADDPFGHKGQGVMRNLAALLLDRMPANGNRRLFWSLDSDQEFSVKVPTAAGDRNVMAVNFFHWLDRIFSECDALVLTGKVVGDPPVSPAVMAANFLEDVVGFLRWSAEGEPAGACRNHAQEHRREGEAAYHDMADMFGFRAAADAYRYHCTLDGTHSDADCFAHFAARLNSFFYGEHPTRVSYYVHDAVMRTVQPARTVYAGNYIFRPEALGFFIPFAAQRLRMSGPTLGRLMRAEIGPRFVSANLPMLHKRTVEATGQAEFRPGIETKEQEETRRAAPSVSSPPGRTPQGGVCGGGLVIDMSGEFERQFYGDVMLFSIERLTAEGFPLRETPRETVAATLDALRAEMLDKYNRRQLTITAKLEALEALLRDPAQWWNRASEHATAVDGFASFAANIRRNFGAEATGYRRINDPAGWQDWRARLLDAIVSYPADLRAWRDTLKNGAA
jgi:hypothetical protein